MLKIGIFGGSFNPCHVEHENVARAMIKGLRLDKLIVVPAGFAPHKAGERIAPAEDRLNMLKIAFSRDEKVIISDYEITKSGVSYTYQTIERFAELYKGDKLYFLVGTDMLLDFCTWRKPGRILELCTLCLALRGGEDLAAASKTYYSHFDKPYVMLEGSFGDISSTAIRAKAFLKMPLEGLVSGGVAEYIKTSGLYQSRYGEFVAKNLPIKRLTHTFGVINLAVRYAKRLKINADDAFLAAALHDAAKYLDPKDYDYKLPEGVPAPVVHQFLGAYVAENILGVENEDVLNAVRYHTTGRANMCELEKVVFLADLLEEGRNFDGVERLRAAVDNDFEKGFVLCVEELYKFLSSSGQPTYYLTKECRDYYCK